MKKGLLEKGGLLLVCCVLLMTIVSAVAYASKSESAHKTAKVYGVEYEYYANVDSYPDDVRCGTYIMADRAPGAGYFAALARAYDEDSILIASGDWEYSGEKTVGMDVCVYPGDAGSYFSWGKVKMYNGDGYNTYTTYKSPIVSSTNLSSLSYEINCNGETYGSGLQESYLGTMPDLVKALGIDGTIGYVRFENLESESFNTPELNIQYQYNNRIIPLYDVDGRTIIGSFKIQYSEVKFKEQS